MRYVILFSFLFCLSGRRPGCYIVEHERDLAVMQPGPHNGQGTTIAYNFFSHADGLALVFRKRVLLPGASIGYHLQEKDEIYYILSGTGVMRMNDSSFTVRAGDAVLTRPGSSHGVSAGRDTLVVIINYLK